MTFEKSVLKFVCIFLFLLFYVNQCIAFERFAIPYFPDKDLTNENKTIKSDDVSVEIKMTHPVKVFKKAQFSFIFTSQGKPVKVEKPFIKFNMKMDMGKYYFQPECKENICKTEIILPKCIWGDDRWFGKLTFTYKSKPHAIIFFFDVKD